MKKLTYLAFLGILASLRAHAQVTITADDMFNQAGQYFEAYSNPVTATFNTGGVMGSAGPNQIWDFSSGPTDVVYRFDYQDLSGIDPTITSNYPDAKLAETKVEWAGGQAAGKPQYLFFTQVAGTGRRVYGAYADSSDILAQMGSLGVTISPVWVFTPPIVDFPEQVSFAQQWSTTTSFLLDVGSPDTPDPTDPTADPGTIGGSLNSSIKVAETSNFEVDAWGTVVLPAELGGGFEQALRVSDEVTDEYTADVLGTGEYDHAATVMLRIFYWLVPGRGIVASLSSMENSDLGTGAAPQMPAKDFTQAREFWRMFQTNKKASTTGGGTGNPTGPQPVTDLKIRVNGNQVLLSWGKATGANSYQLQYSTGKGAPLTWNSLGSYTNQLLKLDSTTSDPQRLYRVVSVQ